MIVSVHSVDFSVDPHPIVTVAHAAEDKHPEVSISESDRHLGDGLTFGRLEKSNQLFNMVCAAHGWKLITRDESLVQPADFAWARAVR